MKINVMPSGYVYIKDNVVKQMRERRLSTISNINSLFEVRVERGKSSILITFDDRSSGSVKKIRDGVIQISAIGIAKAGSRLNATLLENGDLLICK